MSGLYVFSVLLVLHCVNVYFDIFPLMITNEKKKGIIIVLIELLSRDE